MESLKKIITSVLLLFCFSPLLYAKTLNLLDQPAANAKTVGTLDSDQGMIFIFVSPDHNWTKVGDPKTGNVGWIATKDIGQTPIMYNFFTTGNGVHRFQLQTGPFNFDDAKWRAKLEEMRRHQAIIQRDMRHLMDEMMYDMGDFWNSPEPMMNPQMRGPMHGPGPMQGPSHGPGAMQNPINRTPNMPQSTPNTNQTTPKTNTPQGNINLQQPNTNSNGAY